MAGKTIAADPARHLPTGRVMGRWSHDRGEESLNAWILRVLLPAPIDANDGAMSMDRKRDRVAFSS